MPVLTTYGEVTMDNGIERSEGPWHDARSLAAAGRTHERKSNCATDCLLAREWVVAVTRALIEASLNPTNVTFTPGSINKFFL